MKFNKKSAVTTAKNVLIGGAANAAIDLAVSSIETAVSPEKPWSELYVNIGKVVAGAVVGSAMAPQGIWRAAADGVATVGASGLAKSLIDMVMPASTNGVPFMGTGKIRMGQHRFGGKKITGTGKVPFMS